MTSDALVTSLARRLDGLVAADKATLAAYSTDASNHRVLPRCVVFPRRTQDVIAVVEQCREAAVPVTSRGAGTGLAGSALGSGVVLDYSRFFSRILDVDRDVRRAVVEPGVVLDSLQRRAGALGLRFGPDPATHSRCTLGGMIGTNACGARALAWGTTSANVTALDVVLPDGGTATLAPGGVSALDSALAAVGEQWAGAIQTELGRFARQVSGYGLQHLLPGPGFNPAQAFVGSEGTWAQVVGATLDLVELPASRLLTVAGFADIVAAAAAAPVLAEVGALTVEGMGGDLVQAFDTGLAADPGRPALPSGQAWLLVEVGGTPQECRELAAAAGTVASAAGAVDVRVVSDPRQQRALWDLREQGTGLASRVDGVERWPGWEDAAVPPAQLAAYLSDFTALLGEFGRTGSIYGHFGEGCVHVRIDHDLLSASGRRAYAAFQSAAADLVVEHGGSLSGEHGDGRQRSELLPRMYSAGILEAFAAAKAVFDPDNLFNPGLIVDPAPLSRDLRLAISRPHRTGLAFAYADDGGDLAGAARRCVGVGACRASGGGMCPSYQATLDERHSTRGRARILFEMLDGSLAAEGWRSPDVLGALDLCLMCKACSTECPVAVDMATYKAEFLHHHYRRRLRPRSHLSLGWAPIWLALARRTPRLANAVVRSPRLSALVKRVAGIDEERRLPELATSPVRRSSGRSRRPAPSDRPRSDRFTWPCWPCRSSRSSRSSWLSWPARSHPLTRPDRTPGAPSGDYVLLWLDTFTSSFAPEVINDATAVLGAAGYRVVPAGGGLCCGLTWLSTGQLTVARAALAKTVATLDGAGAGCAVVVLEPSCASALRDDAVKLLASDAARRVSSRVRTLAEVLVDRNLPASPAADSLDLAPGNRQPELPPTADNRVLAQFHCHHRATLGTAADRALLQSLGFDLTSVEEGCCGLAGNFGFENGHFAVSRTCAEQSFLPHLTRDLDAIILADGFSCRLQMEQLGAHVLGDRKPEHLATLVRRRLHV